MSMDIKAINNVLQQMRVVAAQASSAPQSASTVNKTNFSNALGNALGQVNETMQTSTDLKTKFEKGDPSVKLADVMISGQKSSLAFEATLRVRNKFIEAYRQIMDMPV